MTGGFITRAGRLLAALFVALFMAFPVFAQSVDINSVTRLDLTKGKINGQKVQYTLNIPSAWRWYLIADRSQPDPKTGVLERISFYYQPFKGNAKPVLLMHFFVYDKDYWDDKSPYRQILRTEQNVFAVISTSYNTFTESTDKALFSKFIREAGSDDFVKAMITLPRGVKTVTSNTITVYGTSLGAKSVSQSKSIVLLPIRDVCQALGYRVGWLDADKAITISKDSFYYVIKTDRRSGGQYYEATMINGVSYVPSTFFTQMLKVNVSIDENANVNITR